MKGKEVTILFQSTNDRRVVGFVSSLNVQLIELHFNKELELANNLKIKYILDEFYDSGMLVEANVRKLKT